VVCGPKTSHHTVEKNKIKILLINVLKIEKKFENFVMIILHITPPSWSAMKQTHFVI
jgi:hypothetical protein